jgi:PAS domain S-box-containing protein
LTTSNRNTTDLNSRVDELERELNRLRLIDQQRRELAAALDESQRKLREVASRAPLVLWAVDQDGIVTMSMGRGLDGLGLTPEQAIGRNVYEMYPDVPEIEQHIRAALRGEEQSYEQEVRGRWFGTWLEPVRDRAGAICGAHGISYDVTDQKTAEHALQESNNFLQAVAQTAPAAIALMAADGSKYRFVSGGIERLLGISPRVFMDFGPSYALSLIHPDDLPRVLPTLPACRCCSNIGCAIAMGTGAGFTPTARSSSAMRRARLPIC